MSEVIGDVAISGDGLVVAISDPLNDTGSNNAGCAWVYAWTGSGWEQRGSKICGGTDADLINRPSLNFDGSVLSLDEFQYAFGWEGRIRVWNWTGSSWNLSASFVGITRYRRVASELTANGDTVIFGSIPLDDIAGNAQVFSTDGNNWSQKGQTIALGADYRFHLPSISADGTRVAVTGLTNPSISEPHAKTQVYEWDAGEQQWAPVGQSVISTFSPEISPPRLSQDGTLLVVGDYEYAAPTNPLAGRVRVFKDVDGVWVNAFSIEGTEPLASFGGRFGIDVDISADGSVFGFSSPFSDEFGTEAGFVKIYAAP